MKRHRVCQQANLYAAAAARCHTNVTDRQPAAPVALDCPLACGTCCPQVYGGQSIWIMCAAGGPLISQVQSDSTLCAARRLFLTLHNPEPRARVFGFKEIYSPWIRNSKRPQDLYEIFDGGVGFLRSLFPRSKFIFHWRENITRIAGSDFWRLETQRNTSINRFEHVVNNYQRYVRQQPEHAFATTLEGTTLKEEYDFWG